ncbi:MAG: terminase, partial [Muribaculaceae bacterium]|nr:terminase [Muribaculaceae bacterium]
QYILNQISTVYPNLYARRQSEDEILQGLPRKYGFHTNVATKPMVISTLVKVIREHLYTERDTRCLDEYLQYERKPNGAYGAIVGHHDDLLMTRAIGLHICYYDMDPPRIVPRRKLPYRHKNSGPASEAVF